MFAFRSYACISERSFVALNGCVSLVIPLTLSGWPLRDEKRERERKREIERILFEGKVIARHMLVMANAISH